MVASLAGHWYMNRNHVSLFIHHSLVSIPFNTRSHNAVVYIGVVDNHLHIKGTHTFFCNLLPYSAIADYTKSLSVEVDGEVKPLIVFDMLMRIHAPSGSEIMLSDMRKILYRLKRDLRFDLRMVTFDGFQSTDSIQLLRKQRISTDYLSVDRSKQPYEDLREGIYEERVLFPRYLTALNEVDVDLVNIAYRELTQLTDVGLKIDHPPKGSKDVADAMAGCVSLLMQMPQWSRGAPILKTDASGEMRSAEVDSDTPGEIAAQVFKGKKGSPHAHERAVTFSEFLASRDARDPGMRPVDDKKDDLPFIGGPVSVPASPFGGIA